MNERMNSPMTVEAAVHLMYHHYLNQAHDFALNFSGCRKVAVGTVIVDSTSGKILAAGANRAIPDLCKSTECLRVQKYGDDSKNHRNPEDCRAIHSEIDAITAMSFTRPGLDVTKFILFITRYPCEACARAIVSSGIRQVVYGRQQPISTETEAIFNSANVEITWVNDWIEEDTMR